MDGLQYLCEALGVRTGDRGPAIAEALAAARRDNEQSAHALLDSVFRPTEAARLCDAVAYSMGRLDGAQELQQWDGDLGNALPILESILSKKYPDVVAAEVLKALQEQRDKTA
jgi:spermidine/putrescine-binding protein